MRRILVALIATSIGAVTLLPGAAHATPIPKTALIYGDSLMWESQWELNAAFRSHSGWTQIAHSYPGTAMCDWTARLGQDLADVHPSVVAVETAGNFTRPCMLDANGIQLERGSDAFYAKYRSDMHDFFSTVTATGAKMVVITAPPMLDPTWNNAVLGLEKIAREVAASYPNVSISASARNAVSATGVYQATKPCLSTETAAMGCVSGRIPIRTNVGTQTGIHFCPTGLDAPYPYACDEYSSGEYRFGKAVVSTIVTPPAAIRPTVKMVNVSGVEGSARAFRPALLWPYSQDLTLCYSTADGTATVAAGDYAAVSGCFAISAWTTTGPTISVSSRIDFTVEASESFKFKVWGWVVPITGGTKTVAGVTKANST